MITRTIKICASLLLAAIMFLHARADEGLPEINSTGDDLFQGAKVAFFTQAGMSMELNAVAMKAAVELSEVFMGLGRFYPVDRQSLDRALGDVGPGHKAHEAAAKKLGCGIYAVVSLDRRGDQYLAIMAFFALDDQYSDLAGQVSLRSSVLNNIPLKLAREAAYMHRGLALKARVIESGDDTALISAGQWHGIEDGRYSTDRGRIKTMRVSRYTSVIRTGQKLEPGTFVEIRDYPDYRSRVDELERAIDRNMIFHFSPGPEVFKGDDPGKRFVKAFCVINSAASLIVPGYGSYLACGYLGVKQKVSIPNVVLTAALVFTQFTLTEMMTDFKSNFAPWIRDSDKSVAVQNLQIFCWSSLLSTYAASFLDQLAHQYTLARKLPPFFEHRNQAAAFLSFLVPGGGLFYKGLRLGGWSFYFAEMALAGYGAWATGDGKNYGYAFGALAIVKVIDILCAYLLEPSYPVYRQERERQAGRPSLSLNIVPDQEGKSVFALSCSLRF